MADEERAAELHPQFSSDDATPTPRAEARERHPPFHFTVCDGAFYGEGGAAVVYQVTPAKAFGFGKGESFSQTRWHF